VVEVVEMVVLAETQLSVQVPNYLPPLVVGVEERGQTLLWAVLVVEVVVVAVRGQPL
jgi:hypothetical protein